MKKIILPALLLYAAICFAHPLATDSFKTIPAKKSISRNAYILAPELALTIATGKEIKHVFATGQRIGVYLGFPIPKTGLNIGPEFHYTHFGNYPQTGAVNHNKSFIAGIRANYFFAPSRKILVFPVTGLAYTWGNDLIKPRKGYRGDVINTYTFKGIAFTAGAGFEVKGFSVRVAYEVNRVNSYLAATLLNEYTAYIQQRYPVLFTDLYKVENPTKMNFDKLVITICYNIHLKNIR